MILTLIGLWVVFMFIVPVLVRNTTGNELLGVLVRGVGVGGCGVAMLLYTTVPLWGAAIFIISPILLEMTVYTYLYYVGWSAAKGRYGEETKWLIEILMEEDASKIERAFADLDQMDVEEAKVIAESKEELREEILDRSDRNS